LIAKVQKILDIIKSLCLFKVYRVDTLYQAFSHSHSSHVTNIYKSKFNVNKFFKKMKGKEN